MIKSLFIALSFTFTSLCYGTQSDEVAFAFDLYAQINKKEDNLAISPYGIFSNLTLVYFGADGQTAKQMRHALHLSHSKGSFLKHYQEQFADLTKSTQNGYQLYVANGLFPHKGTLFLKNFEQIATEVFQAKLQGVDYDLPEQATETINRWIEEKTEGKIENFLSQNEINSSTRMILANAVYFQGEWVHPFSEKEIQKGPFRTSQGETIEAVMLKQVGPKPYFEDEEVQCLALPFVRNQTEQPFLECLLVLPKKGTLPELEKKMGPQLLEKWLQSSRTRPVEVTIPKFCFKDKLSLIDSLKGLGMIDAFTYFANFSKLNGMKDLFLSQVLHETYFSFHENGVTAASATTSQIGVTALPPSKEPPILFTADHPFLFFIVDAHSQNILFMGRVTSPKLEGCNGN